MSGAALEPRHTETSTLELQPVETIIRVMLTPSRALDEWIDDQARRLAPRTIANYTDYVGKLCDELPRDLDVSKITLDAHIRPFLRRWRDCAPGTRTQPEAALSSFFKWLYFEGKIARNPMEKFERTRRIPDEDLDVTTVSPDGVRRLIFHADTWAERLAIGVLAYLGPRRHATALLRIQDYDRARRRIRFREKGSKTIWKPIPDQLDVLIEQAIAAGIYDNQDYLIPPEGTLVKKGDRDDRVIWRLVKRVAERAGIDAHVHALRAAFACFYLDQNPKDIVGLKEILGHKHLQTTEVYLRKMNKQKAMEPVRSLSWAVADPDSDPPPGFPQIGDNTKDESVEWGREDSNLRSRSVGSRSGLAPYGPGEAT